MAERWFRTEVSHVQAAGPAQSVVQSEGGVGCHQGGSHHERTGEPLRRASHADSSMAATTRRGRGATLCRQALPTRAGRRGREGRALRADRSAANGGSVVEKKSCPVRLRCGGSWSSRKTTL